MIVLSSGHKYELENFEDKQQRGQILQFIEKVPVQEGSADMATVHDGTTTEEVLKVLIDRLKELNAKFSCIENDIAISTLETTLTVLEMRTANRKKRGVEGRYPV
jgi:hypothetical protein